MSKKIQVGKKILSANEEYAQQNSKFFAENKKLCLNMISSPGSGKTSILIRTITELKGRIKVGVIEGDICTELDTQRIRKTNAPAVQIETQGSCHLSASQVTDALSKLPTDDLDLIFIENVGNLVCPTAFELGENTKVVEQAKKLNPGIKVFQVSAKTGQGFDRWSNWLIDSVSALRS